MKISAYYFDSMESFLDEYGASKKEYFLLLAKDCIVSHERLSATQSKITGAFFPELIFHNKLYSTGLIALEISKNMQLFFEKEIESIDFSKLTLEDIPTVLTFVDGTSENNEAYLNELFKHVGLQTNILGAGAGSLEVDNVEVFFDNHRFYHNSAVLIALKNHVDLGVKHGWEFLEGPFVVTACQGNLLKELDYKNAYDVYKEIIEQDSGIEVTDDNFLEISQRYPLGIIKYQGEQVVRDIIDVKDKQFTLVGNITENTVINILKGEKQALLNATMEASKDALKNGCEFILMFDCFTRKNFLEEKFEEELDIIFKQNKSFNVVGAISIGEIANNGKNYINFLNKTCVIGGICF